MLLISFRYSDYPRAYRPCVWVGGACPKTQCANLHDRGYASGLARAVRDSVGEKPEVSKLELFSPDAGFRSAILRLRLSLSRMMPPIQWDSPFARKA